MATYITAHIVINDRDYNELPELADTRLQGRPTESLISLLARISGGVAKGKVLALVFDDTGTDATATIACTQANAAGDTITFDIPGTDVVLTEGTDFQDGASDDDCGTNLAAAINAHATLSKFYSAVNASGTVTLTWLWGDSNGIADIGISTSDATAFAITNPAGAAPADQKYSILDRT